MRIGLVSFVFANVLCLCDAAVGQRRGGRAQRPPTLGLDQGVLEFETTEFRLHLVRASQTIAALQPKGVPTYTPSPRRGGRGRGRGRRGGEPQTPPQPQAFDFTPADRLEQRAADGFHHLGDINFRVRADGGEDWTAYSTATARRPVRALEAEGEVLAAADLSPTLPAGSPLELRREWRNVGGDLVLRFTLRNRSDSELEIGGLGFPMVFNNIITGRNLEQAHEICSFFDPYIGLDAGYVQVTRLSGQGPALVVVPEGDTPFEAWHVLQDGTRRTQTSEGIFEWTVHSRAHAEEDWGDAQPWNAPTSARLAAGESRTYGLRFLLADGIRAIEDTVADAGRPMAVGIPGYVAPKDQEMQLFLRYGAEVDSIAVEPRGALAINAADPAGDWQHYTLQGQGFGRARVTVTYEDGTEQAVHYYVIEPAVETVGNLGNFLFTRQWYENPDDPFGRSPSVMSYDRAKDRLVEQDARVWIAGLQDEGGAGSWVAAAMKQFGQPDADQLEKYQHFVHEVLWGRIQYAEGPKKYAVRKSLFFYEPEEMPDFPYDPDLNWGTWTSWDKDGAEAHNRAYNYPHVVAAYWSMYRLARNYEGLVTTESWDWYLNQAYETMMFLTGPDSRVGYLRTGLMEGDVFVLALQDMKREGWGDRVSALEERMRSRADRWAQDAYPFGSEMAWDSTGQEEVFAWCKYFGYDDKALIALDSILGYMPTVAHWGYDGAARRYWDFIYAGAPGQGYERQLHHYGSGINAIPALAQYREQPDDLHLLRIGYAGTMGALTNIDEEGFASVAFHAYPHRLEWDAYSGDYGPNFFGHALNAATYVIDHPDFGWQAFGGNVTETDEWIEITPVDSFRRRVYLAPAGLWLTLDAGQFTQVRLVRESNAVRIALAPATEHTPRARLRIEQPAPIVGAYHPVEDLLVERGAYVVPLGSDTTWVVVNTHRE